LFIKIKFTNKIEILLNFLKLNKALSYSEERFHKVLGVGILVGLPIHLFVFIYYLMISLPVMGIINLLGGLVYASCLFLIKKQRYKLVFYLASAEIIIVTFFDVIYIGWGSGFHYYCLLLVPVYFLYSGWSRLENIITIIIIPVSYLFIYWRSLNYEPYFPLSADEAFYSDFANFILSSIVFLVIILYYNSSILSMEKTLISKNEMLEKGNEDKKVLLKEIHHRVKNNLHVVNSILEVQGMEVQDERLKSYLQDAQRRIISMATIHEKMYGSNNLKYISASEYLKSLIFDLQNIYDSEKKIKIDLEFQNIEVDLDTIGPLAFLVNEVVTNSYKHAFYNVEKPKIFGSLKLIDNKIALKLGDNGSGFLEKTEKSESSLGVDLIESFVNDLEATYNRVSSNGTVYSFVFERKLIMPEIKEK